jgi:hypothetical protein
MAMVAPMAEAKETMSAPQPRPKIAPASSVSKVAAGSESEVKTT